MDKAHVREEHNKYDVEMANKVLQQQMADERWTYIDMNEDKDDGESR